MMSVWSAGGSAHIAHFDAGGWTGACNRHFSFDTTATELVLRITDWQGTPQSDRDYVCTDMRNVPDIVPLCKACIRSYSHEVREFTLAMLARGVADLA